MLPLSVAELNAAGIANPHYTDWLFRGGYPRLYAIEIKAGATINSDFFANLAYWTQLAHSNQHGILLYGGDERQQRSNVLVLGWRNIEQAFELIGRE